MLRAAMIAVSAFALAVPAAVSAELSDAAKANAYSYSIRCFAVSAFAKQRGMRNDNGSRAYDTAYSLGASLGYSPRRIAEDVRARTSKELQTMHGDAAYLDKALADCAKLGLL